jgi:C-terminal processing protease CtpA/Prc
MENYIDDPKQYNNGVIKWGTLKNSRTGYIQISDMNNFANYVKEKSITEKAFYEKYKQQKSRIGALEYFEDEISGVNYIMKQILSDLKDTNPVIIDLRFNGGGYERIALEILSYFVDKTKRAISVSAKTKDGNSPEQKIILEPKGDIYEGQVYLLTSDATASAAEIFALASMQYPDKIFRIGSSTNGIFSEILWKQLPIGWEYSLSNEIYSDPEGKIYEIDGVPCNIDMNYPIKREDFYNSFYKANIFTDETLEMFIKRKTP